MIEIVGHICMILWFVLVIFYCISMFIDPFFEEENTISGFLRNYIILVGCIILALKIYEWA